jgi:PEP-CTERM motif-containing protein
MRFSLCFAAALVAGSLTQLTSAATLGQIDTFQDGTTDGWFAGGLGLGMVPPIPPQNVGTGGPAGAGDKYLQITGLGGGGAGSRIVAINLTQWAGDYLHSGISGISMDLKNFGTSDLTIRLLFEDPMGGPPVDEAVTTFGQALPTGSGWMHAFFAISPSSFTAVSGDVHTLLGNTTLVRIIDSPTPTDAVSIAGVLGVDNIDAVPEPATWLTLAVGLVVLGWRRRLHWRR